MLYQASAEVSRWVSSAALPLLVKLKLIQNYLVYTNTLLFMRSGGNSRFAGVLLAAATFGILVAGPVIIGFIPIMVVGALIFFLGIDLMLEALLHTWSKVHRIEYFTVGILSLEKPVF